MKTDWPEMLWLGLFAATGLIGILIMLPTNDQVSVVRWIEALGGWGAALIAVPSIILLLRQTGHAEEQARQARLPALTARATLLSQEAQFVSDVLKHFAGIRLEYPNIGVRFKDDPEGFVMHTVNSMNAFRSYIGEITNDVAIFNTRNPSVAIMECRIDFAKELDVFDPIFAELEETLNTIPSGTTIPKLKTQMKAIHSKFHENGKLIGVAAKGRKWQQALAVDLGRTQREMDILAGAH